jgi:hypothetical protein
VAVWLHLDVAIEPVRVKVSVIGLYSSADVSAAVAVRPPVTSTLPSASKTDSWASRAWLSAPVERQEPSWA